MSNDPTHLSEEIKLDQHQLEINFSVRFGQINSLQALGMMFVRMKPVDGVCLRVAQG